jgi:PAS domain S-box-containing protein
MSQNTTPPLSAVTNQSHRRDIQASLQLKMTLWNGLLLAVASTILIVYSVITLRESSMNAAENEALAIAESHAQQVRAELNVPLLTARTIAKALEAVKSPSEPASLTRDQVNAMLRQILSENPSFLGVYTLWEPNAFDNLDTQYQNIPPSDTSGRFIPYWVRGNDGSLYVEALKDYEVPGTGDWYLKPRETKKEYTIAPYTYNIQGVDTIMATFTVPILVKDKFYGIAGVDAPIAFTQDIVNSIDLYGGKAEAILLTDSGTLVAVRKQPELSNQPATQIFPDFEQIQSKLATGETFTSLSPDGQYLRVFSPINIGEVGANWSLSLIIPFSEITAAATTTAVRQVIISIGMLLLAMVILWFLNGQVVRPIRELTEVARAVSQGNLNVTSDITSSDETGILASAFNNMTSQLRESITTLEERVADRTKALQTAAEVSRRISGLFNRGELAVQVVEQLQSAFGYYHAHIYLLDPSGQTLVMAGGTGEAGRQLLERGHQIPLGRGLVGRAAANREPVLVPDTSADPGWLPNPLLPETKSEIAVPILAGGQVLGVLDVQNNAANSLSEQDALLIESVADQVAVALQNIAATEEAQRLASDYKSLIDNSPGAIAVLDAATGVFVEANPAALALFDITRDDLNKIGPLQLSPPRQPDGRDSLSKAQEQIALALEKGSWVFEWVHRTLQGKDFLVEIRLVRVSGAAGQPLLNAVVTDITAQRQLQESIRKRAQQQEALNRISQSLQSASTVEEALQVTARELGHALGTRTSVLLKPDSE